MDDIRIHPREAQVEKNDICAYTTTVQKEPSKYVSAKVPFD